MAELIFSLSEEKTLAVPLEQGTVTLGRSPENTVQIDEPSISRRHARLARTPDSDHGQWTVEDLGSVNGVRHNGVRLGAAAALRDGDTLEFGSIKARYHAVEPDGARILAGTYRLDVSLGEGPGFKSYRAHDLPRDRTVSVKVITSAALRSPEAQARLGQTVERFLNAPHPNIISPLRLEHGRDETVLVTEWIAGLPLLDLLRRQRALAAREALHLLAQAASALDHAHAHDFPALDPVPDAILLAPADGGEPPSALLDERLDRWPPFLLKLTPLLLEPQVEVDFSDDDPATVITPAMAASGAYPHGGIAFTLGTLVCEMLGHPLTRGFAAGPSIRPPRIIGLGEAGNAMLRRGFDQGTGFASGREFCAALAAAAGVALED